MTRRRFVFVDKSTKKQYISPEFNGCRDEYDARGGSVDSCDISCQELYQLFHVVDLESFGKACEEAQGHYYSFLKGDAPAPVAELKAGELQKLQANEVAFVIDRRLVFAPSNWDGGVAGLCRTLKSAARILQALSEAQAAPTVQYYQKVEITNSESNRIQGFLYAVRGSDYQGEDNTITHTARFPDGMEMDIKCCGSDDASSWAEAVLFDHGSEVACSEVCESYLGTWTLEHDGILYVTEVAIAGTVIVCEPCNIDQEGVCPICGAELRYDGPHEIVDDGGLIPWTCPNCGATGKEGYNTLFDQHYDVQDGDGKPV